MSAYYVTSILTALTSVSLGIFVFLKNPKNSLYRCLLRLNIFVAVWSAFLFLHYAAQSRHAAMLSINALHAAAVFIPASYLDFAVNLLGIKSRRAVIISYCASLLFIPVVFSPYFVSGVSPKLHFRFYADAGPLYIIWIAAYFLIAGYGSLLMISHYRTSAEIKKIQIKYVLFASTIGFIGGATVFPLFYNIPLEPFGEHLIFLYPIIFTIAVLKHNLLDLNIVIRHTLVYSLSVIFITMAYIVTVLLAERCLSNIVGYKSLWISVVAAVSIALLFTPIKNSIESLVDRFYTKRAYRRLEKELTESNRRKAVADLAAGLAHEIRNPLTAIKTFAEYLPSKYNNKKFRDDFTRIVGVEVEKINSIITRLIEFAKPSAMRVSETDISELLDYTLRLLSAEMIKYNIGLKKDYAAEGNITRADSNKLKHAFLNIIKNAIEAMRGGGTLTVRTRSENDAFRIEVCDTGCGMDEKQLGRIFEAFYSTKEKGAGLGLCVAQGIISEHGGNITVSSVPNKGSCFVISLPK